MSLGLLLLLGEGLLIVRLRLRRLVRRESLRLRLESWGVHVLLLELRMGGVLLLVVMEGGDVLEGIDVLKLVLESTTVLGLAVLVLDVLLLLLLLSL